ncbi:hypothetical protein [Hydrocarboniphaga sp.]|uniref:hypothetical protein n=1 Tax=Hydrocarboniphaga sp. TaxID=2033016 RepID=UPI003D13F7B5
MIKAWHLLFAVGSLVPGDPAYAAGPVQSCKLLSFSGEVAGEQDYVREIGGGLSFVMNAIADHGGWDFDIGEHNVYALNPPYRFGNWLYQISTGYARLAQDVAEKGTKNRFWFLLRSDQQQEVDAALEMILWPGAAGIQDAQTVGLNKLAALEKSVGEFHIVDSELVSGTHRAGEPIRDDEDDAKAFGQILRLKFTVRLNVPAGFKPAPGLAVQRVPCPDTRWWSVTDSFVEPPAVDGRVEK